MAIKKIYDIDIGSSAYFSIDLDSEISQLSLGSFQAPHHAKKVTMAASEWSAPEALLLLVLYNIILGNICKFHLHS